MKKLVVAPGKSMIHPHNQQLLPPGTVIVPGELYSKDYIEICIRSGFIVVESADKSPEAERERALAALDARTTTIKHDAEILPAEGTAKLADAPVEVTSEKTEHTRVSAFNLDPDALRGTSLEDLNVLIAERDPSIDPLESVEEAISLLSMDYRAPKVNA